MEECSIAAAGIAHGYTAREIRASGIVCGRVQRELRSGRMAPSASGESGGRPFRESDTASVSESGGVGSTMTRPSGESLRSLEGRGGRFRACCDPPSVILFHLSSREWQPAITSFLKSVSYLAGATTLRCAEDFLWRHRTASSSRVPRR